MKNKFLPLLIPAMLFSAVGCTPVESDLNIEFEDYVPKAYVGEQYDFQDVLIVEDGVSYTLDVSYQNYYTMEDVKLEVENDFYFTPTAKFDITVQVTAKKGNKTAKRTQLVFCLQKADPIDELISTGGFSGWCDAGITKEVITDDMYLKAEDSHSAISATYQGGNPWEWGATMFTLNNFRLLDHWTDKTWENAVLRMWVYNPTDYDFKFQLRVFDKLTETVNIDWGNSLNVEQVASPNVWTEIKFSLKHIGVDHTLFVNEEETRKDELNLKIKWAGAPSDGETVYSYQVYFNDVDVVPYDAEKYPDLDVSCNAKAETVAQGWENILLDDGWSSAKVDYDRDFVKSTDEHVSRSSLRSTYKGIGPNTHDGYGFKFNLQDEKFDGKFNCGILDFDVHFSDDVTDHDITLILVDNSWVTTRYMLEEIPTPGEDGWIHFSLDLGTIPELRSITSGIRFGFRFHGVDSNNKDTAVIHVDNIFFNQHGGVGEAPELETLADGWENMILDDGWSSSTPFFDNLITKDSDYSMGLKFKNKSANDNGYAVIYSNEHQGIVDDYNLSYGVLSFDVYFTDNITNHKMKLIITNLSWNTFRYDFEIGAPAADGWTHVTLDLGTISLFESCSSAIRLGFGFLGIDDTNKATAQVRLDNINFDQDAGVGAPAAKETIADGWENMEVDSGMCHSNFVTDNDVTKDSVSSKCLTFSGKEADEWNGFCFFLAPELQGISDDLDFTSGTLEFDVKFSDDVTDQNMKLFVCNSSWKDYRYEFDTGTAGDDGWKHVTIDLGSIPNASNMTTVIRIGFIFCGVNETNQDTAVIHLDNITFTK